MLTKENTVEVLSLLRDPMITRLVVEHKDRLTRFGFCSIETLLEIQGRTIEVVNPADNNKEDLLFSATVTISVDEACIRYIP